MTSPRFARLQERASFLALLPNIIKKTKISQDREMHKLSKQE
jgi:hypothetical protein